VASTTARTMAETGRRLANVEDEIVVVGEGGRIQAVAL